MNTKEIVDVLETLAKDLDGIRNSQKNYNSEISYYLDEMKQSMQKHACNLKELQYLFGVIQ